MNDKLFQVGLVSTLSREDAPMKADHLAKGFVRRLGIVAAAFVTHEGMFGLIESLRKIGTGLPQCFLYFLAPVFRDVRIECSQTSNNSPRISAARCNEPASASLPRAPLWMPVP